ncbi:hypothetical protein [Bacteroides sp.]
MAKFIKVILFLLFAVALHCVANNLFAEKPAETQEHAFVYNVDSQEVSNVQLPYLPEGELSSAAQSHQIVTTRIQRISLLKYSMSLKALTQKQSLRETALAQHWGHIYDTTTSYHCYPASEYYVFALRRIII